MSYKSLGNKFYSRNKCNKIFYIVISCSFYIAFISGCQIIYKQPQAIFLSLVFPELSIFFVFRACVMILHIQYLFRRKTQLNFIKWFKFPRAFSRGFLFALMFEKVSQDSISTNKMNMNFFKNVEQKSWHRVNRKLSLCGITKKSFVCFIISERMKKVEYLCRVFFY